MAPVGGIELDFLVVGAEITPHTSYRAYRCIVGASHVHVPFKQHAVHALVGSENGEKLCIVRVTVLAAPSHIKHGFTVGIGIVNSINQLFGIGEAFLFHLALRE